MTSPISTTTPPANGADLSDVVETMLKVRAAQAAGTGFDQASLNELAGIEPPKVEAAALAPTSSQVNYTVSADSLILSQRPAEMAPVQPPPGLTTRGWSPEVTSRHPVLVAAAMEELLAAGGGSIASSTDPIDPNDAEALANAQRELMFAESRKNHLRVAAQFLVGARLADAIDAASNNTDAAKAAYAQAVEEAKASAAAMAPAAAPASTPPPPPAPKTNATARTGGSSSVSS